MILREVNRVGEGKKNVPKLRFKGYEDAWEQRKLGDVKDVRDGTHDSPKYITTGYPLVTSKNLTENGLDYSDISYISEDDFLAINKRSKVEIGDIIFGMIGTIGNPVMVTSEGFAIKNVALLKNNGIINNSFLIHLLKSPIFTKYIKLENAGGTQKFLGLSQIRNFECLIPNEGEQVILGEFFIALDNLITLHQRKYDALKAMKKTLLSKMFPKDGEDVPEIRFKGFTDAWEQRKLGEVGTTYTGLSGKTKEDFGHGNGQFVTYMNVFSNAVASSEMVEPVEIDERQNKVVAGDVLFTTSSETPEEVGMSSVWLENSKNTYLNSFCFGYRPRIPFDPYYLAFMLRSSLMRKKITFLAQGISRYNISKNKMMDIEIPVPIMSEQHQIGEYFRNLEHLITLHQRRSSRIIGLSAAEFC